MTPALSLAWSLATHAQTQTAKPQPIRLVVPFPPACGNIGMNQVALSKPDGVTLAIGPTSNLAINHALDGKMPCDALKDFTPIGFVAQQPVVVVRADAPYKSLADLVKAAQDKNRTLTMASAAVVTVRHLAGELFSRRAKFKFTHVPYKGAAPAGDAGRAHGGRVRLRRFRSRGLEGAGGPGQDAA